MRSRAVTCVGIAEFLEAIHKLGEGKQPVARSTLAERLGITSVLADEMVRKLVKRGLLLNEPNNRLFFSSS